MTDKDLKTIFEKLENLHDKILKSRFAETVTESEVMSLVLAVRVLSEQQAEIERLNRENNENFDKWKILEERTKKRYAELYEEAKSVVRAKAVREFAERLKEKSYKTIRNYGLTKDVVEVCDIDNLVKEMIGDKK